MTSLGMLRRRPQPRSATMQFLVGVLIVVVCGLFAGGIGFLAALVGVTISQWAHRDGGRAVAVAWTVVTAVTGLALLFGLSGGSSVSTSHSPNIPPPAVRH
jgi:hypothetical protein